MNQMRTQSNWIGSAGICAAFLLCFLFLLGCGGFTATLASMGQNDNQSLDGTGVLELAWNDNSDDENGFMIERKAGVDGAFQQIGSVGVDQVAYTDATLSKGSTYCYRVAAYNDGGLSPYTDETCAPAR